MENSRFWRALGTLISGTVIARLVSVLSLPIVTRLYDPSEFGGLTLLTSVVLLLLPFASFRYVSVVALPKLSVSAVYLVTLCLTIVFVQCAIIATVLILFKNTVITQADLDPIRVFWWAIPICFLFGGIYEILSAWCLRQKEYKIVAVSQVTQTLFSALSKISLGLYGVGTIGLIVGYVLSLSGGVPRMAFIYFHRVRTDWRRLKLSKFMLFIRFYSDCVRYRLPAQLLVVASMQAPALYFIFMFGLETGGQIGLALAAISIPMSLILNNVGRILFNEAASIGTRNPQRIYALMLKLERVGLTVAVPISVGLFFISDALIPVVFGTDWKASASFVAILGLLLPFRFLANNLAQLIAVYNEQRKLLALNTRRLILVVASFALSGFFDFTPTQSLWTYVGFLITHNSLLIWEIRTWLKSAPRD